MKTDVLEKKLDEISNYLKYDIDEVKACGYIKNYIRNKYGYKEFQCSFEEYDDDALYHTKSSYIFGYIKYLEDYIMNNNLSKSNRSKNK